MRSVEDEVYGYSGMIYENGDGLHADARPDSWTPQISAESISYGLTFYTGFDGKVIFFNTSTANVLDRAMVTGYSASWASPGSSSMMFKGIGGEVMGLLSAASTDLESPQISVLVGHTSDGRSGVELLPGRAPGAFVLQGSSSSELQALTTLMRVAGALKKDVAAKLIQNGNLTETLRMLDAMARVGGDPIKYMSPEAPETLFSVTFVMPAGEVMAIASFSAAPEENVVPLNIITWLASKRTPYSEELKDARVCERALSREDKTSATALFST